MVNDSSDSSAFGSVIAPGLYHGPGCNGYWDPTDRFLKWIDPEIHWPRGTNKPNGAAFTNPRMSVNWAALSTAEKTVEEHPGYGVVSLVPTSCSEAGQQIEYTPLRDNPAHCDIVGNKSTPRTVRRSLRKCMDILLYPEY